MATKLAVELERWFLEHDFRWRDQDQEYFIPSADQLDSVLDSIRAELVGSATDLGPEDSATLMAGRLFAVLRDGHLDVYVHAGELPVEE